MGKFGFNFLIDWPCLSMGIILLGHLEAIL